MQRRGIAVATTVGFVFALWAQSALGAELSAVRALRPPTIDGDIDDACWQAAPRRFSMVKGSSMFRPSR